MSITGNKGEWSELYVLAKLLLDGKLYACDCDLNKLDEVCFTVLKIMRTELMGHDTHILTDYMRSNRVAIYRNDELLDEIEYSSIEEMTNKLYNAIKIGKRSFEIPDMDPYLEQLHITKIKASSRNKSDIKVRVHDHQVNFDHDIKFSIKSYIGSNPTLFNAAANTKIEYKVNNISDADAQSINAITKESVRNYMVERMSRLNMIGAKVKYNKTMDMCFNDNMMMIDSYMPEIYAEMVKMHYLYKINDISELVDKLEENNILGYSRPGMYMYKVKLLLASMALGMTAGEVWDGTDEANGGYIAVKEDGDIVCFHLYSRDYFERYLLESTKLDRPTKDRSGYGDLYKQDGNWYIQFNCQIRFS